MRRRLPLVIGALVVVAAAPLGSVAPSIAGGPISQIVTAGNAVAFSISISGTGPFTYQWRKNGSSISGATSSSFTFSTTNSW